MSSSVDEFRNLFESGNIVDALSTLHYYRIEAVIKEDSLSEQTIYELCAKLKTNIVKPLCISVLINNLLEKTKNDARESAYKLLLMALRTDNHEFSHDIINSEFLRSVHQTISILSRKFRDDVLMLLHGWESASMGDPVFENLSDACKILKVEGYKFPDEKMTLIMNVIFNVHVI
ncbi:hypothetical protein RF11_15835 [Thelohanellus kitauei]|uniref:VHS domain-containing protein n=1 Tax=Thelohanellus kitauei TaxID=669202 RepID=A0A0C2IUB7_THEKT|nr:hypothetical protein RF11_15835 [Thelohanellus kitauei]